MDKNSQICDIVRQNITICSDSLNLRISQIPRLMRIIYSLIN